MHRGISLVTLTDDGQSPAASAEQQLVDDAEHGDVDKMQAAVARGVRLDGVNRVCDLISASWRSIDYDFFWVVRCLWIFRMEDTRR